LIDEAGSIRFTDPARFHLIHLPISPDGPGRGLENPRPRPQGRFILGFLVGSTSETIQNSQFQIQKERAMGPSVLF
jgi:hypothetical protein